MPDNLAIWNALAKTDPKHTKPFNRVGGFKGTAVKPIWVIKQLTEQFGPCGTGWGVDEPKFQVVPAGEEILVYCTVRCWYEENGTAARYVHGVGGDKVQAKRSSGSFCDGEAFRKAFTDAINNAFKFVGVAADIHMGQFDDDKYVTQVRAEFEAKPTDEPDASLQLSLDGIAACETLITLKQWWDRNGAAVPDHHVQTVVDAIEARKQQIIMMHRVAA